MEKEEAMNVLQFWLAADNFQNQLAAKKGQYDGQEAQNDAMILYDKYVPYLLPEMFMLCLWPFIPLLNSNQWRQVGNNGGGIKPEVVPTSCLYSNIIGSI